MRTMARKPDLLFNVHSLALLSGSDLHFSDEDGDQVLINSCADRNCFFRPAFSLSGLAPCALHPLGLGKQKSGT